MFVFMGRTISAFEFDFFNNLLPGFYTHISNFSISCMLFGGIGYFWLLMGLKMKHILILGSIILFLNLLFEIFISILNTPDITDLYYGIVGTALAYLFLLLTKKYGIKPNPLFIK